MANATIYVLEAGAAIQQEDTTMAALIYKTLLAIFALVVAVLFMTGTLTGVTLYIAGVTAFGLIYFGMMFVLPFNITHGGIEKAARPVADTKTFRERWQPTDMAMQQLKYH